MAFEIKEGRFISRLFGFKISSPAPTGDVMAFLYRDRDIEHNEWFMYYRFRYYLDDKVYDSADSRSEYLMVFEGTFENAHRRALSALQLIALVGGGRNVEETVVESDSSDKIHEILATVPYMHLRMMTSSGQVIQA